MGYSRFSGRERRKKVVHVAMKVVIGPVQERELRGFVVKKSAFAAWKCVPLLVSYCYDVSERNDVSVV